MRRLSILFILTHAALGQNTAIFPTRLPVNADFGIATNQAQTTLTSGITSSTTNIAVTSSSAFKAGSFATIDSEIIAICSIPDGTHVQVGVSACPNTDGRGIDTANGGSAAASHLVNAVVQGRIIAWSLNQPAAEIQALDVALFGTTINVKNYGAKGDGSTDDTTAISNAITASLSGTYSFPPCVMFPQGTYKVTSTIQINSQNVCLQGVTPWSTFINGHISGAIFNLGTFSTTVAPPWVRTSDYFVLRNITLEDTSLLAYTNTGSRTTTGLQSNGSGHIHIENAQFLGLKYGFNAPYGSDFDRLRNVWAQYDDVGIYLGPSCNQFSIISLTSSVTGEGLVLDGAGQGTVYASNFEDHKTAAITLERQQPTRQSWNPASIGSYDVDSNYHITGTWFESGAGNTLVGWQEYRQVLGQASSGLGSYPRHVIFDKNFFVAGTTGLDAKDMNTHSFVEMQTGKFWQVNDTEILGSRIDTNFYSNGGNAAALTVRNVVYDDGYTPATMFTFTSGTALTADFSYTPGYLLIGSSVPGSCNEGSPSFFYYTTSTQWYACGSGGNYVALAQLDGTLHIPTALIPSNLTLSSTLTMDGSANQAVVNQVHETMQAGTAGKWWWQNSGNPVASVVFAGYDSGGTARIVEDPHGGPNAQGSIKTGSLIISTMTYAQMTAAGWSDGVGAVYCSDCKSSVQDSHTTPEVCANSGTGAWAFHSSGNWYCPF